MRRISHYLTATAFVGLMWLPLVQSWLHVVEEPELAGVEDSVTFADVRFDWRTWHSGKLAETVERAFVRDLGLRPVMVRTDNQINLELFGSLKQPSVLGENDELYLMSSEPSRGWLRHYSPAIDELVKKLQLAQVACKVAGIAFVPLVSPPKSEFMPIEELPWQWRNAATVAEPDFMDRFREQCSGAGVHFVDSPKLFGEWIQEDGPPLFPKGGSHWSNYGAARIAIELLDVIDEMSAENLGRLQLVGYEWEDSPRGPDNDIAHLINVWTPERFYGRTARAVVRQHPDHPGRLPRILFIGTSYVANLSWAVGQADLLGPIDYFRYNRNHYVMRDGQQQLVGKVPDESDPSFLAFLAQFDAIVLEAPAKMVVQMNWQGLLDKVAVAARSYVPPTPK